MFEDCKLSQKVLVHNTNFSLLPWGGQQPPPCLRFPCNLVGWSHVTLRERCLEYNHDDYGAMIHIRRKKKPKAQRGCSAFPRSHS